MIRIGSPQGSNALVSMLGPAQIGYEREQDAFQNRLAVEDREYGKQQDSIQNALARDVFTANQDYRQQSLDMDRERLNMARQQAAQVAAQEAQRLGAAAAAAELERDRRTAATATQLAQAGQWEGLTQLLQSEGMPIQEVTPEVWPMVEAMFAGSLEGAEGVLSAQPEPYQPQSSEGKRYADEQALGVELGGGDGGMVVFGPDGKPIMASGGAAGKFTEGQSKDNVYFTRASGALQDLNDVGLSLTSMGDKALGMVPFGLGRYGQSEEYQFADNAAAEFLTAVLRKDTGAAITQQEFDIYGPMFLPMPGDKPAVLRRKAAARQRAVEAIGAGMSPEQILATERAALATEENTPGGVVRFNPETGDFE